MSRRFVVEADGGSRGNPGPAGYGAVVRDADTGELVAEAAEAIGTASNNVAEYSGLIAGLRAAVAADPDCTVEVRMDSKLVVEQMSGRWQVKHPDMKVLALQARRVMDPARVRYTWVPREKNKHADRLANEAMDAAAAGRTWSPSGPAAPQPATPAAATAASDTYASGAPSSSRAPRAADLGEPTTLVLVRHGRSAHTESGRVSGAGGADPELSPAGLGDAARAAAAVAGLSAPQGLLPGLPRIAAVVASPMRRTRQTADAVAGALGLPVTVDEGWIEASFGEWDGLTYGEIARRWPQEFAAWQGSMTLAPPGGESLDALSVRVSSALRRTVAAHAGRVVVVVSHMTPIRAVVREALDAGPSALWRVRLAPCSLTVVRFWGDGGAELVTVNATAHLSA
ncbi:MAG: bifunctional RNase H/acid phosphatase [Kineosporiaceae bacterium]